MTNKENKLKLLENEAVHCETFVLAAQVLELADKLGARWAWETSYLDKSRWAEWCGNTCYLLHLGSFDTLEHREAKDKTISATEWLNRHDIFVAGQEVLVHDCESTLPKDSQKRIYIAPHVTVRLGMEGAYHYKEYFETTDWKYMKSTYPTWEEVIESKLLEVVITLNGKPVSPDTISEETWNKLRKGK